MKKERKTVMAVNIQENLKDKIKHGEEFVQENVKEQEPVFMRTVNKNESVVDSDAVLFDDQQELYQDLLMEQMEQM